jgi:hypothetical protein
MLDAARSTTRDAARTLAIACAVTALSRFPPVLLFGGEAQRCEKRIEI